MIVKKIGYLMDKKKREPATQPAIKRRFDEVERDCTSFERYMELEAERVMIQRVGDLRA